ncbi:hypothetical protein JZ751_008052 [Albula glossodonta]|uniref:Uncharacterized protein n=1 Tax=Albula glossodonta TaxID=121402 RepID=A0A8T2PBZ6_9TELE|nr:hypothetical protein JZ751_008052 [Albula glossodonta]
MWCSQVHTGYSALHYQWVRALSIISGLERPPLSWVRAPSIISGLELSPLSVGQSSLHYQWVRVPSIISGGLELSALSVGQSALHYQWVRAPSIISGLERPPLSWVRVPPIISGLERPPLSSALHYQWVRALCIISGLESLLYQWVRAPSIIDGLELSALSVGQSSLLYQWVRAPSIIDGLELFALSSTLHYQWVRAPSIISGLEPLHYQWVRAPSIISGLELSALSVGQSALHYQWVRAPSIISGSELSPLSVDSHPLVKELLGGEEEGCESDGRGQESRAPRGGDETAVMGHGSPTERGAEECLGSACVCEALSSWSCNLFTESFYSTAVELDRRWGRGSGSCAFGGQGTAESCLNSTHCAPAATVPLTGTQKTSLPVGLCSGTKAAAPQGNITTSEALIRSRRARGEEGGWGWRLRVPCLWAPVWGSALRRPKPYSDAPHSLVLIMQLVLSVPDPHGSLCSVKEAASKVRWSESLSKARAKAYWHTVNHSQSILLQSETEAIIQTPFAVVTPGYSETGRCEIARQTSFCDINPPSPPNRATHLFPNPTFFTYTAKRSPSLQFT